MLTRSEALRRLNEGIDFNLNHTEEGAQLLDALTQVELDDDFFTNTGAVVVELIAEALNQGIT